MDICIVCRTLLALILNTQFVAHFYQPRHVLVFVYKKEFSFGNAFLKHVCQSLTWKNPLHFTLYVIVFFLSEKMLLCHSPDFPLIFRPVFSFFVNCFAPMESLSLFYKKELFLSKGSYHKEEMIDSIFKAVQPFFRFF